MRRRSYLCIAFLAVVTGCGSGTGDAGIHVDGASSRLVSLLRQADVRLGSQSDPKASLRRAWRAFKHFAAIPVRSSELSHDPLSDGLLFEYGIFTAGFEVDFVRQLATADGDLQQVHLDVRFAPASFDSVMAGISVRRCAEEEQCPARCAFTGTDALMGSPCVLAADRAVALTHRLRSASTWSFDTGGSEADEQRSSWIAFVESSPVFRQGLKLKPLRYEVWQNSAE